MPPQKRRAPSSEAQITLFLHWLLTLLFAAAFVLVVVMLFKPLKLPGNPDWPELLLLVSGLVCTQARAGLVPSDGVIEEIINLQVTIEPAARWNF